MTLENIANEDLTLGHKTGSTVTGGAFVPTSTASIKNKANGKGIHKNPLTYSFSGGSAPGVVSGTVRTLVDQSILATAAKTRADGILVMREGDFGTMIAVGDNPAAPPPTLPVSGPVEIAAGGQSKAKAQ